MKDFSKIWNTIILALLLVLLYMVFTTSRRTKEAIRIIKEVNSELISVQDSLVKAQNTIQVTLQKIEFTENELKLLKAERDLILLEEQKKSAKDWDELQKFKDEILRIEELKEKLKIEANKYEL